MSGRHDQTYTVAFPRHPCTRCHHNSEQKNKNKHQNINLIWLLSLFSGLSVWPYSSWVELDTY